MASTGHSGSHSVQSMHSSGSITRKFGPSWKQSTGQTSTQSMYLHLMQLSVTTNAMTYPSLTLLMVNAILPQPRNPPAAAASPCDPSNGGSAFQFREVMLFAARGAVGEVLPQGIYAAGKRQFGPRNVRFLIQ